MTYRNIIIPTYIDGVFIEHVLVKGESVAGLLVHHNRYGYGWVVSTHSGMAIAGRPAGEVLNRDEARRIARYIAPFLPEPVRLGRWGGKTDWMNNDPESATAFRDNILKPIARNGVRGIPS